MEISPRQKLRLAESAENPLQQWFALSCTMLFYLISLVFDYFNSDPVVLCTHRAFLGSDTTFQKQIQPDTGR